MQIAEKRKEVKSKGEKERYTHLYAGQEATVKTGHATTCLVPNITGSKSGNEYIKAVYSHPACLTYMQSTS